MKTKRTKECIACKFRLVPRSILDSSRKFCNPCWYTLHANKAEVVTVQRPLYKPGMRHPSGKVGLYGE